VPFLRVIRDKRGYETTYLIHWYREGTRQRSRILYIFRTPGGVRVGREPLEPEVLRDIEARHPEIAFDWKAVIDSRQVVDTAPDPRRPRNRRHSEDERVPAAEVTASPPSGPRPREDPPSPGFGGAGPGAAAPPRPPIPSAIEGSTPDEQIAFLALWYPIVRDRIPQRTSDPARREALLALAERLNSGAWTDADQIVAGLLPAAESLERLARVFSRRRRRSRRTPTRSTHSTGSVSTVSGAEPSTMSSVEPSKGADGPAQREHAPASAVTDTSSADE
jgi:hypothetical protein